MFQQAAIKGFIFNIKKEIFKWNPKCKSSLRVILQDQIEVDSCSQCNGVWVDFAEEKTLLNMKAQVFSMDELRRLRKHYQGLGKPEQGIGALEANWPQKVSRLNRKIDNRYMLARVYSMMGL